MVSFKNGVVTYYRDFEGFAKTIFEICFAANIITIFVFYQYMAASSVMGILLFASSLLILFAHGEKKIIVPKSTVWYTTFVIYAALSCLWSSYFDWFNASALLRQLIILLVTTSISIYVNDEKDLEKLMSLFIFSIFVITVLEFSSTPYSEWYDSTLGSNFSGSNTNEVSFWVVCAELMVFYKAYVKNGSKLNYILVVYFFYFALLSSSRKALVMGIAGPCLMILFSTYKKFYALRIILAIVLVAAIGMLVMTDDQLYEIIGRRMESMMNYFMNGRTRREDSSLYVREYLISLAKQNFSESPLVGKGFMTFVRIVENDYGMTGLYAHNNYWQILSDLGIIGIIIYYSFYLYCLIMLIKRTVKDKSKLCLMFLTFIILLLILEYGIVSMTSKYSQLVLAMAFTATYAKKDDGRKYKYIADKSVRNINTEELN
jgi:O-antigen ligase